MIINVINPTHCQGQKTTLKIENIRKVFTKININKKLQKKSLSNEEVSQDTPSEGQSLEGYYDKKNIVYISLREKLTTEYYFNNNQLIFVYEKHITRPYIEEKNDFDYTKEDTSYELHYYYDNEIYFH
jgi:hypothetical protein